jgi:hypothetical protein
VALAVNRTGVVFKKCDMSNHRPETDKLCAAGTCQHTCKPDTIEKCKHAWTLRYWVNGRQGSGAPDRREEGRIGCQAWPGLGDGSRRSLTEVVDLFHLI